MGAAVGGGPWGVVWQTVGGKEGVAWAACVVEGAASSVGEGVERYAWGVGGGDEPLGEVEEEEGEGAAAGRRRREQVAHTSSPGQGMGGGAVGAGLASTSPSLVVEGGAGGCCTRDHNQNWQWLASPSDRGSLCSRYS